VLLFGVLLASRESCFCERGSRSQTRAATAINKPAMAVQGGLRG